MPRVRDVLAALERVAPRRFAFSFDKVGLQVGSEHQEVSRAVVALDRSMGAVEYTRSQDAQLLLTHHPLIFQPLNTVDDRTHVGRTVLSLVRSDIAYVAAHTNWDSAQGGVNDTLANRLSLRDVRAFGSAADVDRLKLVFFVPTADADRVIDAVCATGAGVIGAYRRCAFSQPGTGTFIGTEGSDPTVGRAGHREEVQELRVEISLRADLRQAAVRALVEAHPYETPAYDLLVCPPEAEQPSGRLGELEAPLPFSAFVNELSARLETTSLAWGDPDRQIRRIAIVGGAADGEWTRAQRAGADVLVTGEVKQHVALEASESGFAIVAAGHYATEHPGCATLRDRMAQAVPEVEWSLFTPRPGTHGRPFGG